MKWFDLAAGSLSPAHDCQSVMNGATPLADVPARPCDGTSPLAIHFETFSDGRGFSLARHLREVTGYAGPLVARGHLIPDQADFLRRCGFTFVEIDPLDADRWHRCLSMSPPAMQAVLSFPRSRRESGARD